MGSSRKLPMERRQTQKERSVSFTKRRQGLFNKAAELCILCDAQIAVLVASPSKDKPKRKVYSFGNPSVPAVLDAFLHNRVPFPLDDHTKQSLLSLRNEVDVLESESLVSSSSTRRRSNASPLECLDDFENCESVEDLQKIVDGLDNIVVNAKARFDYGQDYNAGGFASVTSDELKRYNMLSTTEGVVEDFKFQDCNKINGVGESSNSSQVDKWNFISSNGSQADNWNLISYNSCPEDNWNFISSNGSPAENWNFISYNSCLEDNWNFISSDLIPQDTWSLISSGEFLFPENLPWP